MICPKALESSTNVKTCPKTNADHKKLFCRDNNPKLGDLDLSALPGLFAYGDAYWLFASWSSEAQSQRDSHVSLDILPNMSNFC